LLVDFSWLRENKKTGPLARLSLVTAGSDDSELLSNLLGLACEDSEGFRIHFLRSAG